MVSPRIPTVGEWLIEEQTGSERPDLALPREQDIIQECQECRQLWSVPDMEVVVGPDRRVYSCPHDGFVMIVVERKLSEPGAFVLRVEGGDLNVKTRPAD